MKGEKDTKMARGMVVLYALLVLGMGAAILANLISIQWVHGSEWRKRGEKREAGLRTDPARRGTIYSSDGKVLATTVTECDFYLDLYNDTVYDDQGVAKRDSKGRVQETGPIVDSNFWRRLDTVCLILHEAVPAHSAAYYRGRIIAGRERMKTSRCYLVQRGVPYSAWLEISRLPGWKRGVVKLVDGQSVVHQVRAHIYGNMAENTIGFRNSRDTRSYTGLEGYYDSILRGQDGIFNCRRLTKGIWLPDEPRTRQSVPQRTDDNKIDTIIVQNKIDGKSIVSTIDTRYQDIAESALRTALRTYGGTAGCAMLMEMNTGYMLACANLAIDTSVHDYREVRDRNVAVSDVYEPGSTFKTVVLTAMLNDPTVTIDTTMMLRAGTKDFGGKYGVIRDDHTLHGRDSLTVKEVIEQSSNVGMTELGRKYYLRRRDTLRLLVENIFPYANLDPDVAAPQYRSYVNKEVGHNDIDFNRFCFGYSTRISALQLLTFYNALGAGGRMVKPQFCRAILDGDRRIEMKPIVMNPQIVSKQSSRIMRDLLEGVVERGTGNNIKNNTYGIAGKTGTAYHNYASHGRYNASFAGFFPSENPRYTCVVMLENVPSFGRQAAVVFKAISDCVVAVDKNLSNGAMRTVRPRLEDDSLMATQRPEFVRGKQADLRSLYKRLRLPVTIDDSAGTWVAYRSATDSTAARYSTYAPTPGRVPNCYGMTSKDAIELLHAQGYKVRINGYGKVKSQTPKAGQPLKGGSTVEIYLK